MTEMTSESFADVSLTSRGAEKPEVPSAPDGEEVKPTKDVEAAAEAKDECTSTPYGTYGFFNNLKKDFYSAGEGALERAVEDIKEKVINKEIDGETILGTWLLVEVDHWDNETEKVVVLTAESLLTVRYDFVPKKVYKFKRHLLKDFDTVKAGDFEYPKASLVNYSDEMKKRTCSGVRLMWNKGVEPGFLRKWNPSSDSMPWLTFTYHPLAFTDEGKESDCYNVKHFAPAAVQAIQQAYTRHQPDKSLVTVAEPLLQDIYLGLPSQVHNQSFLGMSKNRGLLSF